MYGVGGSPAISRDANLLFSSTLNRPDGESTKSSGEFTNSDLYPRHHQQQQGSSLMRYRSAPSSFFASLLDDGDDFLNPPQPPVFATAVDSEPHDMLYPTVVKHDTHPNHSDSVNTHTTSGMAGENLEGGSRSGGGGSSLIRQSSSPAGFFSALNAENGFGDTRDVGSFRVGNGTNGKASSSSRLNGFINFSSGPSSFSGFMPQIAENGNEGIIEASSPRNGHQDEDNNSNRFFAPSFQNGSLDGSGFAGLKRNRDDDEKKFSSFNAFESQNGDSGNYTTGLTHHLSLPKTSAEMAAIEKFLQFQQDSIPCKIPAKRGFATHPRSIAERTRRTRISERMRKLQELFPNMDKQNNTADMLDLAVEYIKDLQKEVKTLTDTQSNCTCSSKQNQLSNPSL